MHCRGQNDDGSKAIQGRSRPARNRTKKVTGGATEEELAEHAARPRPFRPPPPKQMQRNKPKGRANSTKLRVGKIINEAAEALLGMGVGFADDDIMVSAHVLLSPAVRCCFSMFGWCRCISLTFCLLVSRQPADHRLRLLTSEIKQASSLCPVMFSQQMQESSRPTCIAVDVTACNLVCFAMATLKADVQQQLRVACWCF